MPTMAKWLEKIISTKNYTALKLYANLPDQPTRIVNIYYFNQISAHCAHPVLPPSRNKPNRPSAKKTRLHCVQAGTAV